jgi:predicted nucleotidyltransferase
MPRRVSRETTGLYGNEKPILIRGVEYPSRAIAAEVLGVTPAAISAARQRGSLATVGTGTKLPYRRRRNA